MAVLENTVSHLIHNVMPSAADYETAEDALSLAYAADPTPAEWEAAARQAKRRAAELAIAIDGLTDRCAGELACSKNGIRSLVAKLCIWPGTNFDRTDCTERIRGVANAYKHGTLRIRDFQLPLRKTCSRFAPYMGRTFMAQASTAAFRKSLFETRVADNGNSSRTLQWPSPHGCASLSGIARLFRLALTGSAVLRRIHDLRAPA